MNGKVKLCPKCQDCGFPLLPKPVRWCDGCWIRPLHCAKCRCEKGILDVVVVQFKPDDLFGGQAVQR